MTAGTRWSARPSGGAAANLPSELIGIYPVTGQQGVAGRIAREIPMVVPGGAGQSVSKRLDIGD